MLMQKLLTPGCRVHAGQMGCCPPAEGVFGVGIAEPRLLGAEGARYRASPLGWPLCQQTTTR